MFFFCVKNAIVAKSNGKEINMAVQLAGLSSLGVKFGYAVETTAGTKPAAFTQLERCNSVAGIALSTENIDRV